MGEKLLLELLSPARDVGTAREAILAGADSVYIGAPEFGARSAAGNSVADIAELCRFAHLYSCRVYAAVNTILTDAEIPRACRLMDELYAAGVDAAIVQDMGLVRECKSPMPFHSSTQCHLSTPEKARFLSACGFDTLVLARELSLREISAISSSVSNRLECFVHGALCVSYSGQCYLSAAIGGRSGNRGECAQPCRMKYSLTDANGKKIAPDAYFLSLRDMDRSASIPELVAAGVSVFKIEGRLKNADYVKNITAYYSRILDRLVAENPDKFGRLSCGTSRVPFEPNPRKTFSRLSTEYHLHGISAGNESFATPKARGEFLGAVEKPFSGGFRFPDAGKIFSNGDGLFFEGARQFGASVCGIDGDRVFIGTPAERLMPEVGAKIWRNRDAAFEKSLKGGMSRRMRIDIAVSRGESGWRFCAADARGNSAEILFPETDAEASQNFAAAEGRLRENLSKLSDTPFAAVAVRIDADTLPFLRAAEVNSIRRGLVEKLSENILQNYQEARSKRVRRQPRKIDFAKPPFSPDAFANVYNESARAFYGEMGFEISESAPETRRDFSGLRAMITRHCILRELGMCKKTNPPKNFKEPFRLSDGRISLEVKFDCARCGMTLHVLGDGGRRESLYSVDTRARRQ